MGAGRATPMDGRGDEAHAVLGRFHERDPRAREGSETKMSRLPLPRLLDIDNDDSTLLRLVCDPNADPEEMRKWMIGKLSPGANGGELIIGAERENDKWRSRDGYARWVPYDGDYTHILHPANGPGRGAFFVRYYRVEYEEDAEETLAWELRNAETKMLLEAGPE